jgi:hypothetical protein
MSTPTATDTTLVNRAGVDYRTTLDKMSTLQDTDLLMVNRAGVDYKCTAKDIKSVLGGGSGPTGVDLSQLSGFIQTRPTMADNWGPQMFAVDGSGLIFGTTSYFNGNIKMRSIITEMSVRRPSGTFSGVDLRTPFGFLVDKDYGNLCYNNATHSQEAISARPWTTPIHYGQMEACSLEAPYYDNGWWLFAADGYLHFPVTTGTPSQILAASTASAYPTALGIRTPLRGSWEAAAPMGRCDAFGYHSTQGFMMCDTTSNSVIAFHPHTPGNLFTRTSLTIQSNEKPIWIGDYLFLDVWNGNVWNGVRRNVAIGDYSSFVPVTLPANYTAFASGTKNPQPPVTYKGKSGTYYMLGTGPNGDRVILASKNEGLNWEPFGRFFANTDNGQFTFSFNSAVDSYTGMLTVPIGSNTTSASVGTGFVCKFLP